MSRPTTVGTVCLWFSSLSLNSAYHSEKVHVRSLRMRAACILGNPIRLFPDLDRFAIAHAYCAPADMPSSPHAAYFRFAKRTKGPYEGL
jgi:hypothetical protein